MKSGIMNCDLELKQCDKSWSELEKTESEDKRFCQGCEKMVHKIENYEELFDIVKQKKCVAYFMDEELNYEDEEPLIGLLVEPIDETLLIDTDKDEKLPF